MTNTRERFCAVDEDLYKIVETDDTFRAYLLKDDGELMETSPGRIMAVGTPITPAEFHRAQQAALASRKSQKS